MRIVNEFRRSELHELALDFLRRLPGREPGAVGNAKDMRVDRNRRVAEGDVEHHVGGLASDPRQFYQRRMIGRHFASMLVDELAAQREDVFGLGAEQADRLDVRDQACVAQLEHGLRRMRDREELRSREVHAAVGRLRGEHDGDQELER